MSHGVKPINIYFIHIQASPTGSPMTVMIDETGEVENQIEVSQSPQDDTR